MEVTNEFCGDYEIVKPIGKGKFAVVFHAKHRETGEIVALKRIAVNMMDIKARDKCLKEVRLLESLKHPNIIRYMDSFIEENDMIIIVEWAAAGDLKRQIRKAIEKGTVFEERLIWKYFSQICDAIKCMHERRIMHRDLKPANIFLTLDGTVKVGDLGLSRELSENTLQAHSKVGTPLYMSPEVLRGDGYGFQSDVWSLGCLLYELANLKSPFKSEGLNLYSLFQKISKGEFEELSDKYSDHLRKLAYSMIAISPDERPCIDDICAKASEMRSYMQTGANASSKAKRRVYAKEDKEESGGEEGQETKENAVLPQTSARAVEADARNQPKRSTKSSSDRTPLAPSGVVEGAVSVGASRKESRSKEQATRDSSATSAAVATSPLEGSLDQAEKLSDAGAALTSLAPALLLHSKLELLNCSVSRPCRHLHFCIDLNVSSKMRTTFNHFRTFMDVACFLLLRLDPSMVFDTDAPPLVAVKATLLLAQRVGVSLEDLSKISPTALLPGLGLPVCTFLTFLADRCIDFQRIGLALPMYLNSDPATGGVEESELDTDYIEEEIPPDLEYAVDGEGVSFEVSTNRLTLTMVDAPAVDALAWRAEAERVGEVLASKSRSTASLRDGWRGNLSGLLEHAGFLRPSAKGAEGADTVSGTLQSLHDKVAESNRGVRQVEKILNSKAAVVELSGEYAIHMNGVKELSARIQSTTIEVALKSEKLAELDDQLGELAVALKDQLNLDGEEGFAGGPSSIKSALKRLREEVKRMGITIELLNSELTAKRVEASQVASGISRKKRIKRRSLKSYDKSDENSFDV